MKNAFCLEGESADLINGVTIENVYFTNLTGVIRSYTTGIITDVRIINNQFVNLTTQDGKLQVIRLSDGLLSNITIADNSFINLINYSGVNGAIAVQIGDNFNRATTRDVYVTANYFENLVGGTISTDPSGNEYPEVHAVLAYGENINILYNTVSEVNFGKDHEAIYIKASHSTIAHNIVHNGGSDGGGDGDIMIKGSPNLNNYVYGNRVTGDQAGTGMTFHGEVTIENNYVNKKASSSRHGINVYAQGMSVNVTGNHIETEQGGSAVHITDANGITLVNNLFINREINNQILRLRNSLNILQSGNIECQGLNCDGLTPPEPTCQNLGYVCCPSCTAGSQNGYETTCPTGNRCCDPPF